MKILYKDIPRYPWQNEIFINQCKSIFTDLNQLKRLNPKYLNDNNQSGHKRSRKSQRTKSPKDIQCPSYIVYISQDIRFARECSHVGDFNARNKCLTVKLLKQGICIISLERFFLSSVADTMNWFQNSMSD